MSGASVRAAVFADELATRVRGLDFVALRNLGQALAWAPTEDAARAELASRLGVRASDVATAPIRRAGDQHGGTS